MARIAIMGAMAEELHGLHDAMSRVEVISRAGRAFHVGVLDGCEVVLARSGIGKVAAATTAALLVDAFGANRIVFTGVAGGLGAAQVGDIVVADALLQHDMDASPLFPRYEVPLTGLSRFPADEALSSALRDAAAAVLQPSHPRAIDHARLSAFGLGEPRLHRGLVLSGDRFVSSAPESVALSREFGDALAVEMEGAALAQVCHDFGVPFAVMRTVSDRADDSAHVDFLRFVDEVASHYSVAVVRAMLAALAG